MPGKSDIIAGKAFIQLGLKNAGLTKGIQAAGAQMKSFGKSFAVAGAAITAAGAATKAFLTAAALKFADSGASMLHMSERTGIAVESLSALGFAAEQTGQDIDTLEASIKKMQKTIGAAEQGGGAAMETFAQLGISLDALAKQSPDQQFETIADAISKIADPTMRAALAMEVFGKNGTALLPLLNQGAAGIERLKKEAKDLGIVMSTENAEAAASLHSSLLKLERVTGSVVKAIGAALAPTMEKAVNIIIKIGTAVKAWIVQNKGLVVAVSAAATAIVALGTAVAGLGTVFAVVGTGLTAVGAVLGVILSPIGLIVAAITAAGFAFFKFTAAGQAAASAITTALAPMVTFVQGVIKGIGDAIAAGDLELAARIAMDALKIVFLTAWDYIKEATASAWTWIKNKFQDGSAFIQNVWDFLWINITSSASIAWAAIKDIWVAAQTVVGTGFLNFIYGIQAAWAGVLGGVKVVWMSVWGNIVKFFDNAVASLLEKLAEFVEAVPGAHEAMVAFLGTDQRDWKTAAKNLRAGADDYLKERDRIAKQNADKQAAIEAERQSAIDQLQKRQDALKSLPAAERDAQKAADDAMARAQGREAAKAKTTPAPFQENPEIARLRDDLEKAKAQAAAEAAEKEKEKQKAKDKVGPGGEALELGKADVVGTFSAAALAAVGGGGGPNEQTAKNTAAMSKKMDTQLQHQIRMANAMERLQMV